ncbi:MAG TPA: DUF3883 domain-containing protein [Micropepsaceae bacterium]|nr:DUF3883 domain-containing protein [Micropepsaceae bacterium]
MTDAPNEPGGNWTAAEIEAAVEDYKDMLEQQLRGIAYNKTVHRRALMTRVRRSRSSIEYRHRNISAVLEEIGKDWISGYKPARNFATSSQLLVDSVERIIVPMLEKVAAPLPFTMPTPDAESVFVDTPPPASDPPLPPHVIRLARKIDQAERDHRNRELGRLGEQFVLEVEKRKLVHRPDLAARVSWDSQTKGDGLGYDIASFDENGEELFIEAKTTRGGIRTPFFLSAAELNAAADIGKSYRLYRLFRYGTSPQIYRLKLPLEAAVKLTPAIFSAKPK